MPNPNGANHFDRFAAEQPYGAVTALKDKLRDVPLETAPALNAPRRHQRRAVSGQKAGPQGTVAVPPAEAALLQQPPPAADLASVWGEIAAHPEASPLVREYAEMVLRGSS